MSDVPPSRYVPEVWELHSKTISMLFATKEQAQAYRSANFPVSVGGGMDITQRFVLGEHASEKKDNPLKMDSTVIPSQRLASSEAGPATTTDEPSNGETQQRLVAPSGQGVVKGVSQADREERLPHPSLAISAERAQEWPWRCDCGATEPKDCHKPYNECYGGRERPASAIRPQHPSNCACEVCKPWL